MIAVVASSPVVPSGYHQLNSFIQTGNFTAGLHFAEAEDKREYNTPDEMTKACILE